MKSKAAICLLTAAFLLTGLAVSANAVQNESAAFFPGDGAQGDFFGQASAVSGNYAVVGAPGHGTNGDSAGAAYIYRYNGTSWSLDAKLPDQATWDPYIAEAVDANDRFGQSVAISGNYVIIGSEADEKVISGDVTLQNVGSAYVFRRESGTWILDAKLIASDGASDDNFGRSVAISGGYAVVGADGDDDKGSSSGSAYVFERTSDGTWQQISKLNAQNGYQFDAFGGSAAISGDYIIIGASKDDDKGNNSGSAYIFEKPAGGWPAFMTETDKITASNGAGDNFFGRTVAISGTQAIVGAHGNSSYKGAAYVYERIGTGTWGEQAVLTASDGVASDYLGSSVGITDGYAVVGAPGDDDNGGGSGGIYLYNKPAGGWATTATFTDKLQASTGVGGDNLGTSVSASGYFVIGGAPVVSTDTGGAYIFEMAPGLDMAPMISAISDQSVRINTGMSLEFWVYDPEDGGSVTTSVSASPTGMSTSGAGSERVLSIPAVATRSTYTITVTATDTDLNTASTSFELTVHDPPTITPSPIPDQFTNDGDAIDVAFSVSDNTTPATSISVDATSDNQTLIPDLNLTFSGSGANRTLTISPIAGKYGDAQITISVWDTNLDTETSSFLLEVNAKPTISDIQDQTIPQDDHITGISFTIGDPDGDVGALTVTKSSNNQTLLPDADIVIQGTGANRTLGLTPAAGQFGEAIVTIGVSDGDYTTEDTFILTVTADPTPVLSTIANQITDVNVPTDEIILGIFDFDTPMENLTITAESSEKNLVTDSAIAKTYNSGTDSWTLKITPVQGGYGTTEIMVTVKDPQNNSDSQTFTLTVNAAPTIALDDSVDNPINEDETANIPFTIDDPDTDISLLEVTVTSANSFLVPQERISVTPDFGANRNLSITPLEDEYGTATITVKVSDGRLTTTRVFDLVVNSVNDAPTIDSITPLFTIDEDPTDPLLVSFTVSDVDGDDVMLTATSSNVDLIPSQDQYLDIDGYGTDTPYLFMSADNSRTLQLEVWPAPNANSETFGLTTITITVKDVYEVTATRSFKIEVLSVNDAPTVDPVPMMVVDEDTGPHTTDITVSDVDLDSLIVNVTSDNTALLPNDASYINIGGFAAADFAVEVDGNGEATFTLTLNPVEHANGGAIITVEVDDGTDTDTTGFEIQVNPINDRPSIQPIPDRTINEDTSLDMIIYVSDVETAPADLEIISATWNSSQMPTGTIDVTPGANDDERNVTITPPENGFGEATIAFTVSDGQAEYEESFILTVNPQNDAPTISGIPDQTTDEDLMTPMINFTISDVETPASNLILSASWTSATMSQGAMELGGAGENRWIRITPPANEHGTATIDVTVSDGSIPTTESFLLTVTSVDDEPTITQISAKTTNEDTPITVTFEVDDVETDPANLSVTAFWESTQMEDGTFTHDNQGSTRTVTITPPPDGYGDATITLTVSDGNNDDSTSFTLTVLPVNDEPTISDISDRTINEDPEFVEKITFTVDDKETDPENLTVTAEWFSNNMDEGTVVFGGTGNNRWVQVTPPLNGFGTAVITITVSDGELTTDTSFTLTVNQVNDKPTMTPDPIGNKTTDEDVPVELSLTVGDEETTAENLILSATWTSADMPGGTAVIGGTGENRTLTLTPPANKSGTATITVTLKDGNDPVNDNTVEQSFTLTVNQINDAPTVSDIPNQEVDEDAAAKKVNFDVNDVETDPNFLEVTASSSNTTLVPNEMTNLEVGGTGTTRWVQIKPAANQFGQSTISIEVSDGDETTTRSFIFKVNSINDLPTISDIPNLSTDEDVAVQSSFTVSDAETPLGDLVIDYIWNSLDMAEGTVTFSGTGESRTLNIIPPENGFGTATITLTVSDGTETVQNTPFTLTVKAVNDPPVLFLPVSGTKYTKIGQDLIVKFRVEDVETSIGDFVVEAYSSNTQLIPNDPVEHLKLDIIDPPEGTMNYQLTLKSVQNPPDGTPNDSTIRLVVYDEVYSSDEGQFDVVVDSSLLCPDVSTISSPQYMYEDDTETVKFKISDSTLPVADLTVIAFSSNIDLVGNCPPDAVDCKGVRPRMISPPDASGNNYEIVINPVPDAPRLGESNQAIITVSVDNGQCSTDVPFTLEVAQVNDAPEITVPDEVTVSMNQTTTVDITLTDVDTAIDKVTLGTPIWESATLPKATMTLAGTGENRTLTIVPPADQQGTATITLKATDDKSAVGDASINYVIGAVAKGDVNGDGEVDLADLVTILKVLTGATVSNPYVGADVNGDGKIGLHDAIYVLQVVAELR